MPLRVTHLASGLDHLGPGTGPERLDAALFIDVSEGFHRALLAKPAHARLPDLEGHAEGGRLGALDERAEEKVDGRHLRCVFVRPGRDSGGCRSAKIGFVLFGTFLAIFANLLIMVDNVTDLRTSSTEKKHTPYCLCCARLMKCVLPTLRKSAENHQRCRLCVGREFQLGTEI